MVPSQSDKSPALSSEQEAWQSRRFAPPAVPSGSSTCTCAVRTRTPASSWTMESKKWLPEDENPVLSSRKKGLLWAPRCVMLL